MHENRSVVRHVPSTFLSLLMAFCVFTAAPKFALAEEDYTSWITLQASDGTANYSFDTAGNWSSEAPPEEGKYYYVPASTVMKASGKSKTFKGDKLAVAGTAQISNSGGSIITWPELILLPGGLYKHNSNNHTAGKIIVKGTAENPAYISSFNLGLYFTHQSVFEGESDSVLYMNRTTALGSARDLILRSPVYLDGDLSKFCGTMIVGEETYVDLRNKTTKPANRFAVKRGGILGTEYRSTPVVVGDLSLEDGAELLIRWYTTAMACTPWSVTNAFSVSGSPIIRFTDFDVGPGNTNGITVIKLSGPAAANPPDLSNIIIDDTEMHMGNAPIVRNAHLELVDNGDGTKDVRVAYGNILTMRTHNNATEQSGSAFNSANAAWWSSGVVPDSDFDGDAYTAWYNLSAKDWNLHLNYPNMTLSSAGGLYLHVPKVTMKAIYLVGATNIVNRIATYAGANQTVINAPVHLTSKGRAVFTGRADRKLTFAGELSGTTNFRCESNQANSQFTIAFQCANTNYSGAATFVSNPLDYNPAEGSDTALRVELNDGRNLGGAYTGPNGWKSVTVASNTYVTAMADIIFNEPTRGLFVDGGARFNVPAGRTFEIGNSVTYGGEFVKLGAGALVLGGKALFEDGAADTAPVAGRNVLKIAAGTLSVASTNAVDGVAVSFAEGTALLVDPAASGEGVKDYGAVALKWSTPFASASAGGAIPVRFSEDFNPGGASFSAAICTISPENAASLKFEIQNGYKNYRMEQTSHTNSDGNVTIGVKFTPAGLVVIVQ